MSEEEPSPSQSSVSSTTINPSSEAERVLWSGRPKLLAYLYGGSKTITLVASFLVLFSLATLTSFLTLIQLKPIFLAIPVTIMAVVILTQFIPIAKCITYRNAFYTLTNGQLTIKGGAFTPKIVSIGLENISRISNSASFLEKKLGVENITVTPLIGKSPGEAFRYTIRSVNKSAKVADLLLGQIKRQREASQR